MLEKTFMKCDGSNVYHVIILSPVEVKTRCGIDWSRGVWTNSRPAGKRICQKCKQNKARENIDASEQKI